MLDPVPLIAAAAARTARIALGTAVIDPLRRHPAQVAQTALSLAHLSGGRILLGVGAGEAAGTRPYGIRYDRPVARLEEALTVLRLLWSTPEPVRFQGTFFELDDALCGLSATVAPPPLWLAAHGPRTLALTGRLADGWLPTGYGPEAYAEGLGKIRQAARDVGRDPAAIEPGVFVWVAAASSTSRARTLLATPSLRALGLLLPQGALTRSPLPAGPWAALIPSRDDMLALAAGVDVDELAAIVPHGTPDDIAAHLGRYVAAGARHLVIADVARMSGQDPGLQRSPLAIAATIRDALSAPPPPSSSRTAPAGPA